MNRAVSVRCVSARGAFLLLVCLFSFSAAQQALAGVFPTSLRCEYRRNPSRIDTLKPRLSWVLKSSQRAQKQTAYRILVASSRSVLSNTKGDLWDSKKVRSGESVNVVYSGKKLTSNLQVFWKVRAWDKNGKPSPWSETAMWRMGLLNGSDWKAEWICAPGPKAPAIRDHNGYHSAFSGSASERKWVAVDLAYKRSVDGVKLFPACPFDWEPKTPGFLFPLRFRIELSNDPSFKAKNKVVEKTSEDFTNPKTKPVTFRFPPRKARYVRLVVTKLRRRGKENFGFALGELQALCGERNAAYGGEVTAKDSIESGAWSKKYLVDGLTKSQRSKAAPLRPCPMLRKSFNLKGSVKHATAFATALGVYELRINGKRAGGRHLAPEFTDYHRRVQYQTYDVTPLFQGGKNAVAAVLGDGWYCGRIGLTQIVPGGPFRGIYGVKPYFRCQIEIELKDGTTRTIATGPTWKAYTDGPIRKSCLLDGETYDARKEVSGWDLTGFDGSSWKNCESRHFVATHLTAQPNEPIRIVKKLNCISITEPKPGLFVADMGQNMVGWCRVRLEGPPGTKVVLRHGEILKPDGTVYRKNLRMPEGGGPQGARQVDTYITGDKKEKAYHPHFTYHGFRYVEIEGLPEKPDPGFITGCVLSSATEKTGSFSCSSELLNRLMEAIVWTQRGNMHSIPTDCPQRDERMGWMGDAQTFSQTACFNMNMASFFTKFVRDIRDDQAEDGRYPDFAPHPFDPDKRFSAAPAWADGGVIIPWRVFLNYGDKRILSRHLESAISWIEYVKTQSPKLLWTGNRGNDYGDWLNGDWIHVKGWPTEGASVPKEVLATAYFAHSTGLVSKMARVLGHDRKADRYSALSERIKKAFQEEYVDKEEKIKGDTQAGYALALHFNLVPQSLRPTMVNHLLRRIAHYDTHLSTGIQTTSRLMLQLTGTGNSDLAYRLITDRRFPSWGYMLEHGATTIWERWDGYVQGRGLQDPGMNSFNHYAFGSVGEWMYRTILGINPDPEYPGYKRFYLTPIPGGGLSWAKGSYKSIRGVIESKWKLKEDAFELTVGIPANTEAIVEIPTTDPSSVKESGIPAENAPGVQFLSSDKSTCTFKVLSGNYNFQAAYHAKGEKEL